ncbi:hypothetical protein HDU78_009476 [Chytriomyces hyalinus]|nr:hypothetical protein HDU78_009476 [Chytriomyces hyalinus]
MEETFDSAFDILVSGMLSCHKGDPAAVEEVVGQMESLLKIMSLPDGSSRDWDSNHLSYLQKQGTQWLNAADISCPAQDTRESQAGSLSLHERIAIVRKGIQTMSPPGSRATLAKKWVFTEEISADIRELGFADAAYGWQTWSGGALMAYLIANGTLSLGENAILELGCGTGVVGIIAAKQGAKHVVMTDYLDRILENAEFNVQANQCCENASVCLLDWRQFSNPEATSTGPLSPLLATPQKDIIQFKCIIGADICYEIEHGKLVPPVLKTFLERSDSAQIHLVSTIRGDVFGTTFFEAQMLEAGFCVVMQKDYSPLDFGDDQQDIARAIFNGPDQKFRYYRYGWDSSTAQLN